MVCDHLPATRRTSLGEILRQAYLKRKYDVPEGAELVAVVDMSKKAQKKREEWKKRHDEIVANLYNIDLNRIDEYVKYANDLLDSKEENTRNFGRFLRGVYGKIKNKYEKTKHYTDTEIQSHYNEQRNFVNTIREEMQHGIKTGHNLNVEIENLKIIELIVKRRGLKI